METCRSKIAAALETDDVKVTGVALCVLFLCLHNELE